MFELTQIPDRYQIDFVLRDFLRDETVRVGHFGQDSARRRPENIASFRGSI